MWPFSKRVPVYSAEGQKLYESISSGVGWEPAQNGCQLNHSSGVYIAAGYDGIVQVFQSGDPYPVAHTMTSDDEHRLIAIIRRVVSDSVVKAWAKKKIDNSVRFRAMVARL